MKKIVGIGLCLLAMAGCNPQNDINDAAPATPQGQDSGSPPSAGTLDQVTRQLNQAPAGAANHDILTQRWGNLRQGANLNETVLNTNNVNTTTFGKLFTLPVDGDIYAQPLYATALQFNDGSIHNTLFIVTQHNNVYAFDADNGSQTPLWTANFGPYVPDTIGQETGILATPVIDRATNTLYVTNENYINGVFSFHLHALDLTLGTEKLGGPVTIDASIPSTATDAVNGVLTFSADNRNVWQRPGLLEVNGNIYIGFASHDDNPPYHGWLFAYSAANLSQVSYWCATPNTMSGGIWGSGQGLAADANGLIFGATATGLQTDESIPRERAESVFRFQQVGNQLNLVDYFTPYNYKAIDAVDQELGLGSTLFQNAAGQWELITGAKNGYLYINNPYNLGGLGATSDANAIQVLQYSAVPHIAFESPPIWQSSVGTFIYTWPVGEVMKQWVLQGSTFNTTPFAQTKVGISGDTGSSGFTSISANGNQAGTGIVWGQFNKGAYIGELHAFDATNVSRELWNSSMVASDVLGSYAKFTLPTVANGKVYVPTSGNQVAVYGLKATAVDVLTQHNNNQRQGANLGETVLNPNTVNTAHFGQIFTYSVDGSIFAQPLYAYSQLMNDGKQHNVLYAATMHNNVYAFDADTNTTLWTTNVGTYVPATKFGFDMGIMSTPVINRANNAIYLVSYNYTNAVLSYQIHALDLTTGQEKYFSPATITASAPGTSPDAVNGVVTFSPRAQWQRPALLDVKGNIYVAFGGEHSTAPAYHGWVLAYSDSTLQQTGVFLASPTLSGAGIWSSGQGLAADANNDIILATGHNGDSVQKLHQAGKTLAATDYFQPYNAAALDANGMDFGLAGVTLVPGNANSDYQALACSKDGNIYNIYTGGMGGISPNNANATQVFTLSTPAQLNYGAPVYWNSAAGGYIYAWPLGAHLTSFAQSGTTFVTTPAGQSHLTISSDTLASGMLSLSANGNTNGTGVVWAVFNKGSYTAELHAYNAQSLYTDLWNSSMNANDRVGSFAKFAVPTVANGKVYVPTSSNQISVYGTK